MQQKYIDAVNPPPSIPAMMGLSGRDVYRRNCALQPPDFPQIQLVAERRQEEGEEEGEIGRRRWKRGKIGWGRWKRRGEDWNERNK